MDFIVNGLAAKWQLKKYMHVGLACGSAPLLFAELTHPHCKVDKVAKLLENLDVLPVDEKRGNTTLHIAVLNPFCKVEVIRLLLQRGVNVNAENQHYQTPLRIALDNYVYNYDIIDELLDHGASVQERDFHLAVANRNCDLYVIRTLISRGLYQIDSYLFNKLLKNPSCNLDVVKFFLNNSAEMNLDYFESTPLQVYVQNRNCKVEVVRELLNRGENIKAIDYIRRQNLIHKAVLNPNCYDVLLELLNKHNFDINIADFELNTPLHLALRNQNADEKVVALLLKCGANVNVLNKKRELPVNYAVAPKNYNLKIIQMLLRAGAVVWELDKDNISALGFVIRRFKEDSECHRDCVELLVKYTVKKIFEEKKSNFQGSDLSSLCPDVTFEDYNCLSNFTDMCYQELVRMKAGTLRKNFSLLDLLRNSTPVVNVDDTWKILTLLYYNDCPIYKPLIAERLDRSNLLMILHNMPFYSQYGVDAEVDFLEKKVLLAALCVDNIAQHLNMEDMLNLILAYYIPSFCPLKTNRNIINIVKNFFHLVEDQK